MALCLLKSHMLLVDEIYWKVYIQLYRYVAMFTEYNTSISNDGTMGHKTQQYLNKTNVFNIHFHNEILSFVHILVHWILWLKLNVKW